MNADWRESGRRIHHEDAKFTKGRVIHDISPSDISWHVHASDRRAGRRDELHRCTRMGTETETAKSLRRSNANPPKADKFSDQNLWIALSINGERCVGNGFL